MENAKKSPFRPLGRHLKALRDRAKESLAEVSGAVEIDVRQLASYELGQSCPTEEILLLLISHFGARDDEAVQLWELAGYTTSKAPAVQMANDNPAKETQNSMDNKIIFTDVVDIAVNNYGVVMNFMQSSGPNAQAMVISRVGMSREHAKSVLQILQVTLAQTEGIVPKMPKRINSPKNSPDEKSSIS
jgi:hypothetical protein